MKHIALDDFLTTEEKRTFAKKKEDGRLESIELDKDMSQAKMMLRKWDLKSSSNYVLRYNWYKVADRNKLKARDIVQIWFFRSREGKPCFAVVNLGRVWAFSSSSSSASISASTVQEVVSSSSSSSADVAAAVQEPISSSSASASPATVQEPASSSSASAAVVQERTSSSSAAVVASAVAVGVGEDDPD